ncbi:MAG TPA: UDP-N-acetylmuramoyl-tripeptide--D-alanyl-D-alanine ligase [Candidatus Eisenbacteria bacterium]|nr:UDP-N-acetylmuramoyl-tripeptide--D-alanyl-D-alanine ligase [Candidatus Eisenbacteria bacterium]
MNHPAGLPETSTLGKKPLRRWTLGQVAETVSAEWRLPSRQTLPATIIKAVVGATLDSRQVRPGEVFVPLAGTRADGHEFLTEARAHGAIACFCRAALADQVEIESGGPLMIVESPETALQTWGAARRATWGGTAVGVTGSNGKTTTKNLIAAVLATGGATLATEGNRNNHLGVPLTLTGLSDDHAYAVIEMGMNHRGEIARLAEWARPNLGVITHVAAAHLEALGTIEEVARAKAELAEAVPADGTLVIPAGETVLHAALNEAGVRARRVTFALEGEPADVVATRISDLGPAGVSFQVEGFPPIRLRLPGRHNVKNALAALCVAQVLGIDPANAAQALGTVDAQSGRMETAVWGGVTLVLDYYNANPDSMRAALETLRRWPAKRRFAALGGMKELGDFAERGHYEVGEAAGFLDGLYLYGELTAHVADGAKASGLKDERVRGFSSRDELAQALGDALQPGDVVLIKGSRSSRMEEVAEILRARLRTPFDKNPERKED